MPLAGALWFLTAMLIVNIIVFCIEERLSSKCKWLVVAALFALGLFETRILPFRLPWSLVQPALGSAIIILED